MDSKSNRMDVIKGIFEKRGSKICERARAEVLALKDSSGSISSAIEFFANVTMVGISPVFPALVSLSCEVANGDPEQTISAGAAMLLVAAAATIHDDIIDESRTKGSKVTVFGRFGGHISLLAGDALLIRGLTLLHEECDAHSDEKLRIIPSLVSEALLKITIAEAEDVRMRKRFDVQPNDYFDVIRLRAAFPEVHCRLGSLFGKANEETLNTLGHFGRTFGVLSGVREELVDLLERRELHHRIKHECLPYPIMLVLQNPVTKAQIMPLLQSSVLSAEAESKLVNLVLESKEVENLKKYVNYVIEQEVHSIDLLRESQAKKDAIMVLESMLDEL